MATPRVQSVDRAFCLLAALADAPAGSPLATLAARCGLNIATAHRLLTTLAANGAVLHGGGGYRIGMRIGDLAAAVMPGDLLAAAAGPELRRLSAACGLVVQVGVLSPDQLVTYVAKHEPGRGPKLPTRIGSQLEAYCSGLGKVLLAALPADARAAYLAEAPFVALTATTVTDPARLGTDLVTVAACGFAVDDGEIYEGLRCVAVPVGRTGRTIAALSCSGDFGVVTWPRIPALVAQLNIAAAAIAGRLLP